MKFKFFQWFGSSKPPARKQSPRTPSPYRAVAIAPGISGSCPTVKDLAGKVFLVREAPDLPLSGCSAKKCSCRYARRDDRRDSARRSSDLGLRSAFVFDDERRKNRPGRRQTDYGRSECSAPSWNALWSWLIRSVLAGSDRRHPGLPLAADNSR